MHFESNGPYISQHIDGCPLTGRNSACARTFLWYVPRDWDSFILEDVLETWLDDKLVSKMHLASFLSSECLNKKPGQWNRFRKRSMFLCCLIRSWCQPSSRQIWLYTALYWTTFCVSVLLTSCWLPEISRHFYSVFLAGSLNWGRYAINSIKRTEDGTQGLFIVFISIHKRCLVVME